ncbi:hypothetical protein Tco_0905699 [Tanacetum coccineum]
MLGKGAEKGISDWVKDQDGVIAAEWSGLSKVLWAEDTTMSTYLVNKEQHSAHKLLKYREDSNEAAFAVAVVDKIYAHESLTFNNTVACEVISKWKDGLKDDMDARSDAEIWATKDLLDKAKGNVLSMKIVRDQSGNTMRVSQSRFYNGKLEHETLLEGTLHTVGSQEYRVVCTRLDIASTDVGMLDKFDHGLQTDIQVFVDFDYVMGRSITVMGRLITWYGLMIQGCVGS